MYSQENTSWINQTLYQFKDTRHGSDGFLRLNLTSTTNDYSSFNAPFLMLSITNKIKKNYRIDYTHSNDLITAFKKVFSQQNGNDSEVRRRATKNVDLIIKFYVNKNSNERLVRIELLSNETDYTKIIMEMNDFYSIAQCIKSFSENYFNICQDLFIKSIDAHSIREIPEVVRNIPSYVLSNSKKDDVPVSNEIVKEAKKTEETIEDLDKYLGGNDLSNVFVPEIDVKHEEKNIEDVESLFVSKVLDNNLFNLEKMLTNACMSKCPQLEIESNILTKLNVSDEKFRLFAGASEDDIKSIIYCSQVIYAEKVFNYIMFQKSIPEHMPVFKYDPDKSKVDQKNIDLALDLLTIGMFIKCVRQRLSEKESDDQANKSLFYAQLRAFMDVFVYSFLTDIKKDMIVGMISRRFESFNNIGVFDYYKKLLKTANCTDIEKSDISSLLLELTEKGIFKAANIHKLHQVSVERTNYKLPAKSSYTLEQIIEEFIPLEIASQLGRDLNDASVIDDIKSKSKITDEILNLYLNPKKVRKTPERKIKNNILRICKHYDDEVPDEIKEEFINFIENMSDKRLDFTKFPFPIEEFGENIIKALYLWDPEKHKNYKEFFSLIEEEAMTKNLIIAKLKKTDSDETSDWDFTL